jgi:hypothetical protein
MPNHLSATAIETLLLAIESYVIMLRGERCLTIAEAPTELHVLAGSLVETARFVGASEGALIGYLREHWTALVGELGAASDDEMDMYLAGIVLLHRTWTAHDTRTPRT